MVIIRNSNNGDDGDDDYDGDDRNNNAKKYTSLVSLPCLLSKGSLEINLLDVNCLCRCRYDYEVYYISHRREFFFSLQSVHITSYLLPMRCAMGVRCHAKLCTSLRKTCNSAEVPPPLMCILQNNRGLLLWERDNASQVLSDCGVCVKSICSNAGQLLGT
jgi:hypothetical protein